MRIISKFRDFYDSACGGAIDLTFLYKRATRAIDSSILVQKFKFPYSSYSIRGKLDAHFDFVYIFFCGKIYCGVRKNVIGQENKWCFGDEAKEIYQGSTFLLHSDRRAEFFNNDGQDCRQVNLLHDSPIVIMKNSWKAPTAFKDCNLDEFNFATIVDPYQARQLIEVFLRNDLAKDKEVLDIPSNKVKLMAHGFDIKTSFRKDTPPTRKQKKQ